ncbi:MAG TPA: DUF11 domain-containing protein [Gaiellaceae bacterium]
MSTLKSYRGGRGRQFWMVGATLVAAAAFGILFIASSGAANPPCPTPGNFEIDGDMAQHTCLTQADDWNTPNIGVQATTQGGTYSTSHKDDSDPSGWTSTGSTPNKTDFAQAYATSRVVNGHFFVFVAWERTDTTGTQGYAIEVTNAGSNVGADGSPQPIRGSGGSVFYISSQGASAPGFDGACSYTTQSDYGQTCTSSNSSVTMAINTASFTDPLNNTSQPAGGFFEVALDVTALTGIAPSCPGPSAASVYLRSITGQTKNGNLKGYMAPLNVAPDSTCVPPPITTTANPGGSVLPGTSQHDDVTVSDGTNVGVGTVKFFLCSPAEVTANSGDCHANGTQIGSAAALDNAGKASSDAVTGLTTPNDNAPGTYCWRAEFTPGANDHHFLAGSHTNSDTECFLILATPSISTLLSDLGPVAIGTSVHDSSTLSGATSDAAGTVKYAFYSSLSGCNAGTYAAPGGTSLGSKTVAGGVVPDSDSTGALNAAGTYYFRAFYSGDPNNTGPVSSACADEALVVSPNTPGISTLLSQSTGNVGDSVNDSATLSGATSDAGGTVEYAFYSSLSACNAGTYATPGGTSLGSKTVTDGSVPDSDSTGPINTAGTYYFRAFYSGDNNNDGASSVCTDEALVINAADIHIAKVPDAAQVNAGEPIGFTLTVYNDGLGDAHGVTLTDTLPVKAGLDWSIDQQGDGWNGTCAIDTGVLTCGPVTVPAGTSQVDSTFTVHITSDTTAATGGVCPEGSGVITNTGDVSTTNDGSDDSTASTCVAAPEIHIVKTADAAQVNVGSPIGFTLTVSNTGSGDAHGVTLSDTLPTNAGLSWSIASQGAGWNGSCAIAAGKLTCGPVTVPAGTSQLDSTFTVHITSPTTGATGGDCPTSGVVDNTGSVTTSNDGSDQSSASTCVQALVDLSITKAGSPATQTLGDGNITWTIVVTNNGPSSATGVTIADPMPAGNTFVSATATQGSCTGGAILNCSIGTMASGASVTITLVTTPSTVGAQTNTATVAGSRPETNTGNNQASATVQTVGVITPPVFCVAVSKVTPKQLFVGRKTKLTIHVTQHGKAVQGVHVRIKGPKLDVRTAASNGKGVVTRTVKLKKAGILIFSPIASKRCNTKRVGVTNVFTPPVTG